jgi:hypothetical protein
MVDAVCQESTSADISFFEAGRQYTIDMLWAKARGIWRYFKPLREIPEKEVIEREKDTAPKSKK